MHIGKLSLSDQADPDRAVVISSCVRTRFRQRSSLFYYTIIFEMRSLEAIGFLIGIGVLDKIMIADASESAPAVPGVDQPGIAIRGIAAMEDYAVNVSHRRSPAPRKLPR